MVVAMSMESTIAVQPIATSPLSSDGGIALPSSSRANQHSAEQVYDELMARINTNPHAQELRSSLAARLLDDAGALDKGADVAIKDTIHPEQHQHAQAVVSQWSHPSVRANSVVTFKDVDSGDVYVLLAKKYKDDAHHELGTREDFVIPGGYMAAKPALGAVGDYDNNLAQTAARELRDEAGLALSEKLASSLGTLSDDKHVAKPDRQGVEENFHFHLEGRKADMPLVAAKDSLAESFWVKLSDIEANHNLSRQARESGQTRYHFKDATGASMAIRDDLGEAIDVASHRLEQPLKEAALMPATPPTLSIDASSAQGEGKLQVASRSAAFGR
jgi:hypothetical protein